MMRRWDWGPSYAPAGIHGDVRLVGTDGALVTDVGIRQEHLRNGSVALTADVFFRAVGEHEEGQLSVEVKPSSSTAGGWKANALVKLPMLETRLNAATQVDLQQSHGPQGCTVAAALDGTCKPALLRRSITVMITPPFQLWYPWEFGSQPLYNVSVTYAATKLPRQEQRVERQADPRTDDMHSYIYSPPPCPALRCLPH